MLRSIDSAASLSATSHERFSPGAWPPLTVLQAICEALHEGLAVHRHYEALRSRGSCARCGATSGSRNRFSFPRGWRETSAVFATKSMRLARGGIAVTRVSRQI
jgi:hypothetical protein